MAIGFLIALYTYTSVCICHVMMPTESVVDNLFFEINGIKRFRCCCWCTGLALPTCAFSTIGGVQPSLPVEVILREGRNAVFKVSRCIE